MNFRALCARTPKALKEKGFYHVARESVRLTPSLVKYNITINSMKAYSWLYSRVFNKPLIHVIGDSHVHAFEGNRLFYVHHIGMPTAYNLKNKDSTTNSNKKLFAIINKLNTKLDRVIMVFGEIDCRIHIYNQYKKSNKKVTLSKLIERTISSYGEVLDQLACKGVTFFVCSVPPAAKQKNVYKYPHSAPPKIRSRINKEFNEKLKKFCRNRGYGYIDIYQKVHDKNGFILKKYSVDEIHLNYKIQKFVEKWLKNS